MSQPERRPVVLRGGTVLSVVAVHTVLEGHDVLVVDDRIAGVGVGIEVPAGTEEIDARGGIVMPGMVDTHRHMWQTAMRGYGADWTLTQYFVWYYLEHGVPGVDGEHGAAAQDDGAPLGLAHGRAPRHSRTDVRQTVR